MYSTYFGFRCLPFDRLPEPDSVFQSVAFLEALAALRGCVDRGAELALLSGAQGAGKTTTLRALAAALERDGTLVLVNDREAGWETLVDASLAAIAAAVGTPRGDEVTGARDGTSATAVVLVDDAHELPAHVLRHLPSLVTSGAELGARVTVLLAAQPELSARLRDARLGPLRGRLTCRHELAPLAADELEDYVHHKLEVAGYRGPELFDSGAIRCLVQRCGGNPRWVDLLCGLALLVAFDSGRRLVDERIVTEAANDHPGFSAGLLAEEGPDDRPVAGSAASGSAAIGAPVADEAGPAGIHSLVARVHELLRPLPALARRVGSRLRERAARVGTASPRPWKTDALAARALALVRRLASLVQLVRASAADLRQRRSRSRERAVRTPAGRAESGAARERDLLELKLAVTGVLTVGVLGLGLAVLLADAPAEPDEEHAAGESTGRAAAVVARSPIARLEKAHEAELVLLREEMKRLRTERDEALIGMRTRQTTIDEERAELSRVRSKLAAAELEMAQAALPQRPVSLTLPVGAAVTFAAPDGERLEVGSRARAARGDPLVIQARMSQEFIDILRSLHAREAASADPSPAARPRAVTGMTPSVTVAGLEQRASGEREVAPVEADVVAESEKAVEAAALAAEHAGAPSEDTGAADAAVEAVPVPAPAGEPPARESIAARPEPGSKGRTDVGPAAPGAGGPARESVAAAGVTAPPAATSAQGPTVIDEASPQARAQDQDQDQAERQDQVRSQARAPAPAGTPPAGDSRARTSAVASSAEVDVAAATLPLASEPGASIATPIAARTSPEGRLALRPPRRLPAEAEPREDAAAGEALETREPARVEEPVRGDRPAASAGQADYVVVAGDTLSGIARRVGATIAELREWNGLDGDMLRIGQRLKVRSPHGVGHETNRALLAAAAHGQIGIVRGLLAAGASPDARDEEGRTALMQAARRGHYTVVKALAEHGADIQLRSASGATALSDAAWAGHAMVLSELLERGAEVNAANEEGWTPLMYASINGHLACVQALIDRGAKIDARNHESRTALSAAAWNGHAGVVRALLESGAQVDERMPGGWTALMEAAWNGDAEIVTLLLEHGADPRALSDAGLSPASLAAEQGHAEVAAAISRSVGGAS